MTTTILQGDCWDVLKGMADQSIDAIITDPPYLDGDLSAILDELLRVGKRVVVTPGKFEAFNWIRRRAPAYEYAWKCSGTKSLGGQACLHILFEPVLAYGLPLVPLGSDLLDYPLQVDPLAEGHPWPKPLPLFKKLVAHWTKPGQTVFDPFMGSGTTGVAAVQLGRQFIGCEIKAEYFRLAQRRIAMAQAQPQLFVPESIGSAPVPLFGIGD